MAYNTILLTTLVICGICKVALTASLVDSTLDRNLDQKMVEQKTPKRAVDLSAITGSFKEGNIEYHSEAEKKAILDKHNEFRSKVDPLSSNMNYMRWNSDLEKLAGLWTTVCYFGHGLPARPEVNMFPSIGQNLWYGGSKENGVNCVKAWHDNEIGNYQFDGSICKPAKMCGHYAQVVAANSTEVGCARSYCSQFVDHTGTGYDLTNKWYEACFYAPAGSYPYKPYRAGAPCSECNNGNGQCYKNLCRPCSEHSEPCECKQTCGSCGTVATDCTCSCQDGWWGWKCHDKCENKDSKCGKTWPYFCGQRQGQENCDATCKKCVAGGTCTNGV